MSVEKGVLDLSTPFSTPDLVPGAARQPGRVGSSSMSHRTISAIAAGALALVDERCIARTGRPTIQADIGFCGGRSHKGVTSSPAQNAGASALYFDPGLHKRQGCSSIQYRQRVYTVSTTCSTLIPANIASVSHDTKGQPNRVRRRFRWHWRVLVLHMS